MYKSIEALPGFLFIDSYDPPQKHNIFSEDVKVNKLLSLHFVACRSLVVTSDTETNYKYKFHYNNIIIVCNDGQVVRISSTSLFLYDWVYDFDSFKDFDAFLDEESYNRIFELCKKLIDKINDKFQKR